MSNLFPWLGGNLPFAFYPRSLRDDSNTACGNRPDRIDRLMDADCSAPAPSPTAEALSRSRKIFPANNIVRGRGNAS